MFFVELSINLRDNNGVHNQHIPLLVK